MGAQDSEEVLDYSESGATRPRGALVPLAEDDLWRIRDGLLMIAKKASESAADGGGRWAVADGAYALALRAYLRGVQRASARRRGVPEVWPILISLPDWKPEFSWELVCRPCVVYYKDGVRRGGMSWSVAVVAPDGRKIAVRGMSGHIVGDV